MKKDLYYCLLERIDTTDIDKLLKFFSPYPTYTPVISVLKNSIKAFIYVFADWGGADKVVWKKFKNPKFPKYITAKLYKVGISTKKTEYTFDWAIIERRKQYYTLNHSLNTIFVKEGTGDEEIEILKELVMGNAVFYPCKKDEQILIL